MSMAAALGLGLLIGAVLGALGGGGAILTVPLLVYVLGESAQDATTSSLVIVGLTAAVGTIGHARAQHVRWRTGIVFGLAGLVSAYAGTALNRQIDERVLLIGFAVVMIAAAIGMLARAGQGPCPPDAPPLPDGSLSDDLPVEADRPRRPEAVTAGVQLAAEPVPVRSSRTPTRQMINVVAAGLTVGFLTGLFGVGGGFVIVPALTLALGLPMPIAVGTSLLIIALNSASALAARAGSAHFDWAVIAPFTLAAMAGTVAGRRIADRLPNSALNRAFAFLLILVAAFVGVHNALALV
jgi:uncharacterized membrane protein YfcA